MIASAALLILAAAAGAPQETVDLFESHEYRCAEGQFQGTTFNYRLFVPRSLDRGRRYPLLLWLHGRGDAGSENKGQLRWIDLMLDDPAHAEKYRFFLFAVQCPSELSWFEQAGDATPGARSNDDLLTVTTDILRTTMRERPVDPDRVYLVGISAGASASWEIAMRWPELFAAVVPMASAGSDESRAASLRKIPIWAFINESERNGVEKMVAAVRAAGGNAYLTVADAPGHNAWSAPLRGGILQWILAQRRGATCWTPPSCQPWQWWHILTLPVAVVVFIRLAWALEQRRRWWRARLGGRSPTGSNFHQGDVHDDASVNRVLKP